ncbi:hypothetical protein AB2B38_008495 [Balneola sp. MJW-20]|uniref:hypothetical protein n=1 Tax=Gracilimonas aurantiaca TaxID=3234185 RepID=UPI003466AE98
MKKTIVSIFVVCFAIVVYGFTPNSALMQSDNAAIINMNDGTCGMSGADIDGNRIFGGFGIVELRLSNNNKAMIVCKGTGLVNDSGSAQHYDGFNCGVISKKTGQFYITQDSQATVSKNGNGTLKCTVAF